MVATYNFGSVCFFIKNTNYVEISDCRKTIKITIVSKKGGKNQETIQSSTTHDPGYHIGK